MNDLGLYTHLNQRIADLERQLGNAQRLNAKYRKQLDIKKLNGQKKLKVINLLEAGAEPADIAERAKCSLTFVYMVRSDMGMVTADSRRVLTDEQIAAIRDDSRSSAIVAAEYGCSKSTVKRVRKVSEY